MTLPRCTVGPWDLYPGGLILSEAVACAGFLKNTFYLKSVKLFPLEIVPMIKVYISQREKNDRNNYYLIITASPCRSLKEMLNESISFPSLPGYL